MNVPQEIQDSIRREVRANFRDGRETALQSTEARDGIADEVIRRLRLGDVREDYGYAAIYYVVVDELQR